jgi:hypothetical protein
MGFLRFRRSFRIAPGLRVNLSRSGVSASVGRRGACLTIGPRGTRETIGIPGTGLSYTEQQRATVAPSSAGGPAPEIEPPLVVGRSPRPPYARPYIAFESFGCTELTQLRRAL